VGWGDEIMAAGQARAMQKRDPRKVAIVDVAGRVRWHPAWQGNPRIAAPIEAERGEVQWLENGPGCRPYVDYARMRRDFARVYPGRPFTTKVSDARLPWRFTRWRTPRGEIYGRRASHRGETVVVEPHLKRGASRNKQWGWSRWQDLVARVDVDWIQLGPPGTRLLTGVRHVPTATFLEACAALSGARAAVLPEGGLHHAAAALGLPAVVIFGGRSSPANLGYAGQVNLFDPAPGESPCGQTAACAHCARAMAGIAPAAVGQYLETLL
jgi:hypothetical protein